MRRVASSPNVKKFVEELVDIIESSPNVSYVSDVHERIDGRWAFTIAGKNRRISVIIDDSKDEAIMLPIYYDDELSATDEVSAPIDFSDINYSCNSILDVAREFDFPTSSDLKASKKTAANDIVYDNNIDSPNGISADFMYFDSDADDEDVYGPVVSIMFDYGKDMYEACYFNNPEKVGLYSGEFDQEPDAVEYFKTRSEAKKWGEDQLRQPMLAFASKKHASNRRIARGFHSRWNESDMYDFVDGAVDDINRRTYSDIMAGNLNSYEGDEGEVYTFDIMSDYFTLYVEVDGTNVSISCEDDPSLDQAWDFDEDYSSSDLADDLFNIASDAENVFIEMSEEDEEVDDPERFASARTAAISDEYWENYKKRMQEQDAKYAELFESFEKFMQEMIEGIRGTSDLYRVTNIKASNNRGDYPRITGSFIVRIGKKLRVRVYLCVSQKGADEDWAEYVEMSMGPTNEEMAGEYGGEDFTDSDKAVEWAVENLSLYQERYPELVDPELGEQLKSFESQKGWELFF